MTSEDDSDFEDALEGERVKRHLISRRCSFPKKSAEVEWDKAPI
jgi:hypothetical protein